MLQPGDIDTFKCPKCNHGKRKLKKLEWEDKGQRIRFNIAAFKCVFCGYETDDRTECIGVLFSKIPERYSKVYIAPFYSTEGGERTELVAGQPEEPEQEFCIADVNNRILSKADVQGTIKRPHTP